MNKKWKTKSYFVKRVGNLAKMLKFPEHYWQLELHCYNPGYRNLYQLQFVDKRDGSVLISLPKDFSYNSTEFDLYLEGIIAAGRSLEGFWRED